MERAPKGIVPLRFPKRALQQMPDALTREPFRMSSGVRLAFATEASVLEVEVAASLIRIEGMEFPTLPVTFDLLVNSREHGQRTIDRVSERTFNLDGDLLGETPAICVTVRFDRLPRTDKTIEVWLPANAVVELRAVRANASVHPSEQLRPSWVHHGSSISHCVAAHSPTRTWPAVAARLGGVELLNLGVAGNCHLDQFVARAIRDASAACISLKVGVNIAYGDTLKYRTFVPAVHGFLDTVREGHPETPILIVSPIICPVLENAPGPILPSGGEVTSTKLAGERPERNALTLRRMREILAEIVAARAGEDRNLHYLDGLSLFGEADLPDLPDGLHPSADGYVHIGERFARTVFSSAGCFGLVSEAKASRPRTDKIRVAEPKRSSSSNP